SASRSARDLFAPRRAAVVPPRRAEQSRADPPAATMSPQDLRNNPPAAPRPADAPDQVALRGASPFARPPPPCVPVAAPAPVETQVPRPRGKAPGRRP